jgi:RING finger/CHY zinc finger protein 1
MSDKLKDFVKSVRDLDFKEKSKKIQEFMNKTHTKVKLNVYNEDLIFNCDNILGCKHYKRNCKIEGICCDTFFTCRLCHNDHCDHEIERSKIEKVKCLKCDTEQSVSNLCENCNLKFGNYFCEICKFFDNDELKDIYHCEYCKICRLGKKTDFFHCEVCRSCISMTIKDTHKCVQDTMDTNCPICSDYLFTSTQSVSIMPCGHSLHSNCYIQYASTNYKCPLCCKSLADMTEYFKKIDLHLEKETMPDEDKDKRSHIFCSDCEKKCITPFHYIYHKCEFCGSYNTKILNRILI